MGATNTPVREREKERERERERDDRGRVLRVPLVAPPSLFQPRDGVGFDRYDDDDHTCFYSDVSSFYNAMGLEEEEEGKMCVSLSLSRCFFVRARAKDVVGKSTSALFLSFFLSFSARRLRLVSVSGVNDRGPGGRANDFFLVMWDRFGGIFFVTHHQSLSLSLSLFLSP